jgi:hypothetical protein
VYSQRDRGSWISINPETNDFGRNKKEGFVVHWSGWEENFTRKVDSVAELLKVLKPILLVHEGRTRAILREEARNKARALAKEIKAAKANVKKLEAQQ